MTHAIYLWRTQSLYDARHLCRAHAMLLGSRQCIMCSTVLRGNVSCAPPQRIMCSTVAMSHVLYRPSSFHPSLIFSLKSLQSLLAPGNVLIPSFPPSLPPSLPPFLPSSLFRFLPRNMSRNRWWPCATYPPFIHTPPSFFLRSLLASFPPCFQMMAGIRRARVIGQWWSTSW